MRAILVAVVGIGVATAYAQATRVAPVVSITSKVSKTKTESTLTVAIVSSKLMGAYADDIHRCVRERFGNKAKAGTLKLVFGVEPDGKTIGVVAASYDKKLDRCIAERARAWTFDPPRDKADKPIATSFVFEFALAPLPSSRSGNDNVQLEVEESTRFADALFADEVGSDDEMMSRRKPGADLGGQLRAVGDGKKVTYGGGGGGPHGRISVASKAGLDSTTLTPDSVLAKIQSAYMTGLRRCYRTALKSNATAKGKLQMSFTVDTTGRTSGVIAKSFDASLDTCVKNMMHHWRFPAPKAGAKDATARFEFALSFVPD
jgi:hypothetical protein